MTSVVQYINQSPLTDTLNISVRGLFFVQQKEIASSFYLTYHNNYDKIISVHISSCCILRELQGIRIFRKKDK